MSLLERNYFEVFGIAPAYSLDSTALQAAYLKLQSAVHPDRLVNAPPAHKRIAMQLASHVNQAKLTLENPLSRAAYLCQLRGAAIDAESNTKMPLEFLMQQMEWREAASELGKVQVRQKLAFALSELQSKVANLLDVVADSTLENSATSQLERAKDAAQWVRQWMFLDKLEQELNP